MNTNNPNQSVENSDPSTLKDDSTISQTKSAENTLQLSQIPPQTPPSPPQQGAKPAASQQNKVVMSSEGNTLYDDEPWRLEKNPPSYIPGYLANTGGQSFRPTNNNKPSAIQQMKSNNALPNPAQMQPNFSQPGPGQPNANLPSAQYGSANNNQSSTASSQLQQPGQSQMPTDGRPGGPWSQGQGQGQGFRPMAPNNMQRMMRPQGGMNCPQRFPQGDPRGGFQPMYQPMMYPQQQMYQMYPMQQMYPQQQMSPPQQMCPPQQMYPPQPQQMYPPQSQQQMYPPQSQQQMYPPQSQQQRYPPQPQQQMYPPQSQQQTYPPQPQQQMYPPQPTYPPPANNNNNYFKSTDTTKLTQTRAKPSFTDSAMAILDALTSYDTVPCNLCDKPPSERECSEDVEPVWTWMYGILKDVIGKLRELGQSNCAETPLKPGVTPTSPQSIYATSTPTSPQSIYATSAPTSPQSIYATSGGDTSGINNNTLQMAAPPVEPRNPTISALVASSVPVGAAAAIPPQAQPTITSTGTAEINKNQPAASKSAAVVSSDKGEWLLEKPLEYWDPSLPKGPVPPSPFKVEVAPSDPKPLTTQPPAQMIFGEAGPPPLPQYEQYDDPENPQWSLEKQMEYWPAGGSYTNNTPKK